MNDVPTSGTGRHTVGGRYVFHHMIWSTRVLGGETADAPLAADDGTSWPVHEVGREADFFDSKSARLLKAGSFIVSDSVHLHSNGRDTKARLEIAFKFMPRGYQPEHWRANISLGNGVDIDIRAMEPNQQLHAYAILKENTKILSFEPHLHAPGARMCLEAIWGYNIQTTSTAWATTTTGCGATTTTTITRRCCRRTRSCTSSATWTTRCRTRTCPIRATGRAPATARSRTCSSTSATVCP